MRRILAIAILVGLSGCGSTDFFGDSASTPEAASAPAQPQSAPAPAVQTVAEQPPAPVDAHAPLQQPAPPEAMQIAAEQAPVASTTQAMPALAAQASADIGAHCRTLAKQRSIDAAFEGEDGDTQTEVYQRTYRDCIAWDVAHRS
jgi:hypothetical protein